MLQCATAAADDAATAAYASFCGKRWRSTVLQDTAVTELFLGANEFRQLGSLLKSMGLSDTHNARVTVRVLDGTGRVTAYVSVIDMLTNDPTYVPAQ